VKNKKGEKRRKTKKKEKENEILRGLSPRKINYLFLVPLFVKKRCKIDFFKLKRGKDKTRQDRTEKRCLRLRVFPTLNFTSPSQTQIWSESLRASLSRCNKK
jgi:hypothetical protein